MKVLQHIQKTVFDYFFGKEAEAEYVIGTRKKILNDTPIIGRYNLNQRFWRYVLQGANMLHTLHNW